MKTGSSESASGYLTALFRDGTLSSKSDSELLELFIAARSKRDECAELAFSALLARHGPMVLRVCLAALGDVHQADDAFQATFLILASRAWSIRRHVSIGSWLYGVALRVAGTERSRAARRNRHERRHAEMMARTIEEPHESGLRDNEAVRVLHQEIGLLPERYRSAVVLCYLEGLTHETAAERLGRPVGTVRSRLATARDRLRARLTRRGLAPAIIPALTVPETTLTVVPAALEEATVRASLEVALGKRALAGAVSAEALTLVEGTLKTMTITRWGLRCALMLVAGFVTAGAGAMALSSIERANFAPPGVSAAASVSREPTPQERIARPAPSPALVAAAKPAGVKGAEKQPAGNGPIVIQAETVDEQGKHLAGVSLGLSVFYTPRREPAESLALQTVSNDEGRGRLEGIQVARGETIAYAFLWAYKPGRSLASTGIPVTERAELAPVRLVLEAPKQRTITVAGPDGRPIEGLRLVPRTLQRANARMPLSIPEDWGERLTVTTDAKGMATIPYLSRATNILTMRVHGPGIARHTVDMAAQPGNENYALSLGRTGRLVGVVRNETGQPLSDVPLEVWVRAAGTRPMGVGAPRFRRRSTPTEVVRFDGDSVHSGPQGAFQTSQTLLGGSTYRVAIHREGFAPFVSDWVTLDGERATIPEIRLLALRKLAGSVRDRHGQPVAQARVFMPSHGPTTTTNAQGRFELSGVLPENTFVIVRRAGFRIQGWPVVSAAKPGELALTLARTDEEPICVIEPLGDPLPAGEFKVLAERLLQLDSRTAAAKQGDGQNLAQLLSLIRINPNRVREMLENGQIKDRQIVDPLRGELAIDSEARDPGDAKADVLAIADLRMRVHFLVRLATERKDVEPALRKELLDEAVVQARAMPESPVKINVLEQLIKALLDAGMSEQAKPLVDDGLKILDSRPRVNGAGLMVFLAQAARLDSAKARSRIEKVPDPEIRDLLYGSAAIAMAISHPADAERFYGLSEQKRGYQAFSTVTRLCRQLAKVDVARATRIAGEVQTPGARACAWAYTALGASDRDKQAAHQSLDKSLEAIDSILESGPGAEPVTNLAGVLTIYPSNPAVLILPVVEQIAPELLAEFFWRAVALHDRVDVDNEDLLQSSGIGFECMLLSHYDRQAAALLFQPMDAFIKTVLAQKDRSNELTSSVIVAKACLDPKAGVELLESLGAGRELSNADAVNEARRYLAGAFSTEPGERWKRVWRTMRAQVPLEE